MSSAGWPPDTEDARGTTPELGDLPPGPAGAGPEDPHPPLRQRFLKAVGWAAAGSLAAQALAIPAGYIAARLLGKVRLGQVALVHNTVGLFGQLAGLGLGLTATKYVAELRYSAPERAGRIIALTLVSSIATGGLASLICVLLARWLATHVLDDPTVATYLYWGALLLFARTFAGTQSGVLLGFEAFEARAKISFVQAVTLVALSPILIWRLGVTGALLANIAESALGVLLMALALRRECRSAGLAVAWREAWLERKLLWGFSLPSFLARSTGAPVMWAMTAILVNQRGGYGELGLYNAANRWRRGVSVAPGWVGQSVLPIMSSQLGEQGTGPARRCLRMSILAIAAVVLPVAALLVAFSPQLMALNGPDFGPAWPLMIVCIGVAVIEALAVPLARCVQASGHAWIRFAGNGARALTAGVSFYIMRGHGAMGLAYALALASLVEVAWLVGFVAWMLRRRDGDAEAVEPAPEARDA